MPYISREVIKSCRIIREIKEVKEIRKDVTLRVRASRAQEVRVKVPAVPSRVARADSDPVSKDSKVRAVADRNRKATVHPG